nr:hypothetical protein [Streptomyces natalensis]
MSADRTRIAVAAIGAVVAASIAVQAPALIPALTLGLVVWGALYMFLKL